MASFDKKVILVTGGSGLVGKGVQEAIALPENAQHADSEEWIFLTSKDADLRNFEQTKALFEKYKPSTYSTSLRLSAVSFAT